MRWSSGLSALCLGMCVSSVAFAQTEVSNDSFDQNQSQRIATSELLAGEMYAADFQIPANLISPQRPGGVELLGVRVVMVADPNKAGLACGRYRIEVYKDAQLGPQGPPADCFVAEYEEPGDVIYSMETQFGAAQRDVAFEVRGDPSNYQDLLFSSVNSNPQLMATIPPVMIDVPRIRVGLLAVDNACGIQQGDYFPLILTDTDGERGENFLYGYPKGICPPSSTRFYYWRSFAPFFSVPQGDFVMRLLLRAPNMNPTEDMGQDMMMIVDMGSDGSVDMMPVDMATARDMMGADMAIPGDDMGANDQDMKPAVGALQLTSVSPSSVTAGTGTDVAILGKGFVSGLELSLNARKIGVVEVKPERILATIPADLAPMAYDVIVTNPNGSSAILPGGFVVKAAGSEDMGAQAEDMSAPGKNGNAQNSAEDGCSSVVAAGGPAKGAPLLALWALSMFGLVRLRRWRGMR